MTVTDVLVSIVEQLSAEEQQKVLAFAQGLKDQVKPAAPCKDPMGMYEHLGVHITLDDIREMRREAWANFPRDFPPGESS